MGAHQSPFTVPTEKRSPFPRQSLPQAGESLREAARDLIFDKFFIWAETAITIGFVAVVELVFPLLHLPVTPWYWVGASIGCAALATWRWFRIKPQLKTLLQGMRGEREVGRMLEGLRAQGYTVFHDIPGEGFNIDHALVGPAGVFAIETKTWSMPEGKRAEVDYDGKRVLVNGHAPDRDPVAQTAAVADYLRELLKRMADREVAVRPVLLFPGWWVTPQPKDARIWVLNPKALHSFLKNEPTKLSREDIALFADRLTLHLSSD